MAIVKKSNKKNRNIHPNSKVKKKKKKKVSKGHPLAALPKTHVDADDIDVVEDDELTDDDTSIDNIDDTDIEALSSPDISASDFGDSLIPDSVNRVESVASLDIPENISFDTANVTYTAVDDGSYRATVKILFDEVFRASDYEVRISEVK